MTQFTCDICGQLQPKDETAANWFTAAVTNGGKGIRLFRWPMGSHLQEPHDSLLHVCARNCLHELMDRWEDRAL